MAMADDKTVGLTGGDGSASPAPFDGISRTARVDPHGDLENLPVADLTEEQAESKRSNVRTGAELMREFPPFPEARRLRDKWGHPVFWLLLIGVVVVAMQFHEPVFEIFERIEGNEENEGKYPGFFAALAKAAACGVFTATALGLVGLAFFIMCPTFSVWCALLGGPLTMMIVGMMGPIVFKSSVEGDTTIAVCIYGGVGMALAGLLMLTLVLCCYRPFIPLTIKMMETLSSIIMKKPGMILISLFGAGLDFLWQATIFTMLFGMVLYLENGSNGNVSHVQAAILPAMVFALFFGSQVITYLCHVTYCGVFSRWYYGFGLEAAQCKSLTVSMFQSFGSIVFGSALIAGIRTLEFIARQAEDSDSGVVVIIACVFKIILSCIGDWVEFFSEWAYVQCAVRGVSFMEAVRITFAMCTCANLQYLSGGLLVDMVTGVSCLFNSLLTAGIVAVFVKAEEVKDGGMLMGWSVIAFLIFGFRSSSAIFTILSSGSKAVLMGWAENPEPLKNHDPALHDDFEARVLSSF